MDAGWLNNINSSTLILVPTRSLVNALQEQYARQQVNQGTQVWETPNIMVWQDYLRLLLQQNKHIYDESYKFISSQQGLLIWQRIIKEAKYKETELTLLNVQQTAKAAQKSWRLMQEWHISEQDLANNHDADTRQFLQWVSSYQQLCSSKNWLDSALLAKKLLEQHQTPFNHIVWYAWDLKTTIQQKFSEAYQAQGKKIEDYSSNDKKQKIDYVKYETAEEELTAVLQRAREIIEAEPEASIALVIPDLTERRKQVEAAAKQVFYPDETPLNVQSVNKAYRFSLGNMFAQWPQINTALSVLSLLRNSASFTEISALLRNGHLPHWRNLQTDCIYLERWLRQKNCRRLSLQNLQYELQDCLQFNQQYKRPFTESELSNKFIEAIEFIEQLQQSDRLKSLKQWSDVFSQWLTLWGWRDNQLNSVQYQIYERWEGMLEEYAGLDAVQAPIELRRALEILNQLCRDAVFSPQAGVSPLLISGMFEAIGQPVDYLLLTGMNENYPPQDKADAFISRALLRKASYPEADAETSFIQAEKVVNSLQSYARNITISFAASGIGRDDKQLMPSPLFRKIDFRSAGSIEIKQQQTSQLQPYQDTQGPAWPKGRKPDGGSRIFENQSVCQFKAFVSHQLGLESVEEPEFGLNAMDRGNIVHALLERLWKQLKTSSALQAMSEQQTDELIEKTINDYLQQEHANYQFDRKQLLQIEQPRLNRLLQQWLEVERNARKMGFSVAATEHRRDSEFAGVPFRIIIDRIDNLEDGNQLIIDYKTGSSDKPSDWVGSRPKKPQLPLYLTALMSDEAYQQQIDGISYARVRYNDSQYTGFAEHKDIADKISLPAENRQTKDWQQQIQEWHDVLHKLADDFLAGKAEVNPIDESICKYCELESVCRINQLRAASGESAEAGK